MHPVQTFLHYLPEIHFNIILSTPISCDRSFSLSFPDQEFVACHLPRQNSYK